MPPCSRYLIRDMPANLNLYYLITISTFIYLFIYLFIFYIHMRPEISTFITSILIIFIALISLSLYSFNNSFTSDLSDKRIEIDSFFEYDIFIVFIVWGIFSMRLISIFNSSIRFISGILSDPLYLINMNLFEVSVFLIFFFFTVLFFFYTVFY